MTSRSTEHRPSAPQAGQTAQCLISFGSNLGDRHTLIAEAARRLTDSANVLNFRASRLFETPPIGGPGGQEPFLNAVAAFDTPASAHEILQLLQLTETQLGRERRRRWDARSIDLDVVLHGQLVGGGTALSVPHPRYTARQFVLQPACDVASHYRDPRFGWTLRQLTDHLHAAAPSIALAGGDNATRHTICQRLASEYQIRTFQAIPPGEPMAIVGNAPAPRRQRREPTDGERASKRAATSSPLETQPAVSQQSQAADPPLSTPLDSSQDSPNRQLQVPVSDDQPWVSAYVPLLPELNVRTAVGDASVELDTSQASLPRLIARMQTTTPETRWPAPHQMWPMGWKWPEYRLEIDDLDWAVSEIASALDSMRCEARPVSEDGSWWS